MFRILGLLLLLPLCALAQSVETSSTSEVQPDSGTQTEIEEPAESLWGSAAVNCVTIGWLALLRVTAPASPWPPAAGSTAAPLPLVIADLRRHDGWSDNCSTNTGSNGAEEPSSGIPCGSQLSGRNAAWVVGGP